MNNTLLPCYIQSPEVEKIWNEHWLPLVVDQEGVIQIHLIANELSDYCHMITNTSTVFSAVTGGEISKPNTLANAVIGVFEEKFIGKDTVADLLIDSLDEYDLPEERAVIMSVFENLCPEFSAEELIAKKAEFKKWLQENRTDKSNV